MTRVILTYGTFDLFHIGHLRLLERARAMGTKLIVGVSTDEFNATKNKRCVIPFSDRREIVQALRCVDSTIPEASWEQKAHDIVKFNASTLVMGDDWSGKFDALDDYCDVVYLPRTDGVSSTRIRSALNSSPSQPTFQEREE